MASENNRKAAPAGNVERQSGSANAARMTKQVKCPKSAPRPVPPKAKNSFQPGSDGLLLRLIAYDAKGQIIPGIRHLFNSLIHHFDSNDPLTLLATEMAVADYARLARGLKSVTKHELSDWYPAYLTVISRNVDSSRRNLNNSLNLLRELEAERAEQQVFEEQVCYEAPVASDGKPVLSEYESPCPSLTKDDLFSEKEWSSLSNAVPSEEASGAPANVGGPPTEGATAVDATARPEENEPVSEGQTYTPTEHPYTDEAHEKPSSLAENARYSATKLRRVCQSSQGKDITAGYDERKGKREDLRNRTRWRRC